MFNPWVEKIPWRKWQPTPLSLPGEFYGQRSLVGYIFHGVTESDTTEQLTLSLCPPMDIWQYMETILVVLTLAWGGGGTTCIRWREVKDIAKHPITCRKALDNKE